MTNDKSLIQSCIDHINTAVDVDPWARELVCEMGKEILKQLNNSNNQLNNSNNQLNNSTQEVKNSSGGHPKWETCFDCPLSHGCHKINGCTNSQAEQYASEIPADCPLSAQLDVPDTNVGDMISRHALISTILGMTTFGNVHELNEFIHKHHLDGERMGGLRDAVFAIVNAPSVQPTYTDEQIQKMQEMEQAQLEKAFDLGREDAKAEIVRCKDCKFWTHNEELTPEEAASEIASGSIMSASYWLDLMIRLKQMGYVICRKENR